MNVREFQYPPKEYRTSPFWAWNDQLAGSELCWQVREMKEQGFGGFFMHAREGLKTGYLSQEWFECVSQAAQEAEKLGMEAWLYDEDRWPSGCAGGIVTAENDEYKARWLVMSQISEPEIESLLHDTNVAALFRLTFDSEANLTNAVRIRTTGQLAETRRLDSAVGDQDASYWQFRIQIQNPTTNSNSHGYIDVLNPDAVAEFLRVTHEQYKNHVGQYFGSVIPGIFADEPTYRSKAENSIPWSPLLPGYFSEDHDYDVIEHLPALFFDCDNSAKIRYDFYYTLTRAFVTCFTRQIYDWCDQHDLKFTGHYLSEDTLVKQTYAIGAAMPHYQYMHVPGIDHLGNNIGNHLTLKQCASVGNQFGRKRLLCEIFGVSGHAMTFEDQKWIANFHYALGIAFLSQHLVLYSMTGDRKRDYPPTFSYHQPYWPYYHRINDYMARAGYFCSQGEYVCDTLVLHPIGSVWATFARQKGRPLSSRYDAALRELQECLFKAQVPFDYGDELIMEEHAKVVEDDSKTYLQIGSGRYSVVIVPPSLSWSSTTFELLKAFVKRGGKLIFVGELPSLVSGEADTARWQQLFQAETVTLLTDEQPQLIASLAELCQRPFEIKGTGGCDIMFQVRKEKECWYLFITNTNREISHSVTVTAPSVGHVFRCDFETGAITEVCFRTREDRLELDFTLAPADSRGYIFSPTAWDLDDDTISELDPAKIVEVVPLNNEWRFTRTHLNSLTLDYCRYTIGHYCGDVQPADQGNGSNENDSAINWSKRMPVWQVRRQLWQQAGFGEYQGVQPWVVLPHKDNLQTLPIKLQFEFYAEDLPEGLGVVIENSQHWKLKVNGVEISTNTDRYYWDKQFGQIDIGKAVKHGKNLIELAGDFQYGVDIEEIYLVGNFALRQSGYQAYRLVKEPSVMADGSWVYQGYPFYAGNMIYTSEFDLPTADGGSRCWIRLNQPKGTLFRVSVNNGEWKYLIAQPWVVDISEDCLGGRNQVRIEVVGSLRNTFGPLHHRLRSPAWCGPKQFEDELSWVGNYQFEDYGLLGGAELIISK